MSHRPLVLVGGLTAGDYLLWNWSLNSNHEVLALVSGLTLPPLAVACVWLLALNVARLIARSTRGRADRLARQAVLRESAAGSHSAPVWAPRRSRRRRAPRAGAPAGLPLERRPPGTNERPPPGARRARARRLRLAAAGLVVLLAAAALGGYLYERHRTGSIYHPHARFVPQPTPTLPKRGPERFSWPLYGYTKDHTRFFPAAARVHPPFKKLWVRNGHALLEFPPVIYGDVTSSSSPTTAC